MRARSSPVLPLPADIKLMNTLTALLCAVFAGMVFGAVFYALMQAPWFRLQAIEVQGDLTHNNAVVLHANVAPQVAGNFFTVDLARVRAAFESVPWVRQAVVRREFPNRLRVVLQEHQAAAYWGAEEDVKLVSRLGEVFEVNEGDVEQDSLPTLNGPKDQADLLLQAYRLLAPLFEKLEQPLLRLDLTVRGNWRARLEGGAVVELGRGEPAQLHARTRQFVATLAQVPLQAGRSIESVDLRYSNGYALKLQGVTTVDFSGQKSSQ